LKQRDIILLDKQIKNIRRATFKHIESMGNDKNLNIKLKKTILNQNDIKRESIKCFRNLLKKKNNNKFLEDARKIDKE
jgi:hypothetical protein